MPGVSAPASALPAIQDRAKATIVIALPPIHPRGAPIDWTSNALSGRTSSVTVKIGKVQLEPIALDSSNSRCIAASAGLTCTIVATVKPKQKANILVQTYAKGVKLPLASGQTTANVYPGRNVIAVTMTGIARHLKIFPGTTTLHRGQYVLDKIYVDEIDAARAIIPSASTIDPVGTYISIRLIFSGFYNHIQDPGNEGELYYYGYNFIGLLPYDGLATTTETIAASVDPAAGGKTEIKPATITLTPTSGVGGLAPLAFGITVPAQVESSAVPTVAQFPLAVSGSPTPVRQFINSYGTIDEDNRFSPWPIYGEDATGDFWIGNAHLSNSLGVLGTVSLPTNVPYASAVDRKGHLYGLSHGSGCAIYEFPHRYGSLKPIREIDGPCAAMVATDGAGNIYVADTFDLSGSGEQQAFGVQEFAATGGSGAIAPTRNMIEALGSPYSPPYGPTMGFLGLGVDDVGNVYVAAETFDDRETRSAQVYKFAPGETSGTVELGGLKVLGFVVDGAGDIYAQVPTTKYLVSAIEEFAPGATTPMRTFSGAESYGMPILVPR